MSPEEQKEKVHDGVLERMFDVIDTGKGYNSLEEVKAFYKIIE